jgi:hypothetical protein
LKWIIDLNLTEKVTKFLEENIRDYLPDLEVGKDYFKPGPKRLSNTGGTKAEMKKD